MFEQKSLTEKINADKTKKIFIIIGISIFAFQALYFISAFGINFPQYGDVWIVQPHDSNLEYKEFLFEELFKETDSHIAFFPKSLLLVSLFFDSLNLVNLMYFGWTVLLSSLIIIYFLLKQTDEKLTWLIIPISAFVFSPLQHFTLVWAFGGLQWELTLLGVVGSIYFLNKTKLNHNSFVIAITMGIIATFSLILGLVVWIIGFLSFVKRKTVNKKWMIMWLLVTITIFSAYLLNVESISENTNFDSIFSDKSATYVLTYLSIPFRLKFSFLNLTAGIGTMILLIGFTIYFLQKKNFSKVLPWMQFALMGVLSGMVSAIGRMGNPELESWLKGHTSYYVVIANLPQIALMVFLSLLFLEIKKKTNFKYKKALLVIILIIIIIQIMSLIPSYYLGWQFGEEFYQKNSLKYSCFSQSSLNSEFCHELTKTLNPQEFFSANFLLENNLSVFLNNNFNPNFINNQDQLKQEWNKIKDFSIGIGAIETVNDQRAVTVNEIMISEPLVMLSGWMLDGEGEKLDSLYLLLDEEPLLKNKNFEVRNDIVNDSQILFDPKSGWKVYFLSGYLNGCHTITIGGVHADKKIILDEEIQICKK